MFLCSVDRIRRRHRYIERGNIGKLLRCNKFKTNKTKITVKTVIITGRKRYSNFIRAKPSSPYL
jgi:hypothetical protein